MAHEIEEGLDGLYSICVFKAESCSDEEIYDVFGRFGDIVKISRISNIVFLRYQTREEAVLCFESMQGDARFIVKPGKRKGGSNSGGRTREGKVGEMNRNDNFHGRRPETGGGGDGNFGRPNFGGSAKEGPPKLIPFPSLPKEEAAASPPTAKIVIMGNLHPKFGQNNIYELCTKVQAPPLHVAMKSIKRPPYPNIYYAIVYVRNDKEAENIVTSFNNLKLNGYKMVVNMAEKLSEEGKSLSE